MAWAWIMRITGLDLPAVFSLMQVVNVTAWLAALGWLVSGLVTTRHRLWIPMVTVTATSLTLWGVQPLKWSSYLAPSGASFMWPFPSTAGLACTLLLWGIWVRGKGVHAASGAVVAVVTGFHLASHPCTTLVAWSGFAGLACYQILRDRASLRSWVVRGLWVLVGAVLAFAWPYSDLTLLATAADRFDEINLELGPLLPLAMVFVLLGIPALWLSRDRAWAGHLAAMALAGAAVTAAGGLLTGSVFRLVLAIVLPLQVAAGLFLAETLTEPGRRSRPRSWTAALTVGCMWLSLLVSGNSLGLALPDALIPGDGQYSRFVDSADSCTTAIAQSDPGATIATPDKSVDWTAAYSSLPMATRYYPEFDDPDFVAGEDLRQALIARAGANELRPLLDQLEVDYTIQTKPGDASLEPLRVSIAGCESCVVYRVP